MKWLALLHDKMVFQRRVTVLSDALARMIPAGARVLDVGCGDGTIAALIMKKRPDVAISGIDILVRSKTLIPVTPFDGAKIPFEDKTFDAVMFNDVLHHTDDPSVLLAEARRVAKDCVVLKDHFCDGLLARQTLSFMDWVGNAPHGVVLPYNYLSSGQWSEVFSNVHLRVDAEVDKLGLYAWPFALLFDRRLHFIARLARS
jgi:SAM-dependent methyltransferase